MTSPFDAWHRPISKSIRRPAFAGIALLGVLFGGFGVWAATAPIASAVVASGLFVASGQNKHVQHLEGGIIRQILVREGDAVVAGQPLVILDDTAARADVRRLEIKQATLQATLARLDAERLGQTSISFPKALLDRNDAEIASIVATQAALFRARQDQRAANEDIIKRQVAAIRQEIVGLEAQMASYKSQLALITPELVQQEQLYANGLSQLNRLLQVRRGIAKFEGDIGEIVAEIGRAEQRILEAESRLAADHRKFIEEAVAQYREASTELGDTEERLVSARAVLERTTIPAPATGIIVKLNYHTPGGVIGSGQPVLEILPTEEKLVVEAFVRPDQRDSLFPGMSAEMRLTAFNARTTPMVEGIVTYVSADKIAGKREGEFHYIARVTLSDESMARLPKGLAIKPGMPAEVFFKTGERTFFDYLMRPITDSMHRGGREE
jgi:HlyD family secretion protein